jgi:hypothetical protein
VKDLMPKLARVTLATVRRLALSFPGVEEGPSSGTPGFQAWRRQAPRRMVAEYDRLHP